MTTNQAIERLRAQFLELEDLSRPGQPGWLSLVRKNALERFLARGFPTTRDEEWRFTNVAPLVSSEFALPGTASDEDASPLKRRVVPGALDAHELVFVNGQLSAGLSAVGELPDGVVVTSLRDALSSDQASELQPLLSRAREEETPFHDLNEAFLSDGAFVHVSKNVVLDKPVHLVFLSTLSGTPFVSHLRNVVVAAAGSQVRVLETFAGTDDAVYWTNAVTDVVAAENAVVDHTKLQRESADAFHVASLGLVQERSAVASSHSVSLGARLARHDIRAELDGEGADVTLNGLYAVRGRQHVDHHTVIDHRTPHCTSRELYKGILDDTSSGVFNGRVIVRADAQKTDSQQSNKNLLLSDDALVNTNPQLEINADDVKCAHGATIGQLDADAIFYLRTRGIAIAEARRILTEVFMSDVSDRISVAAVRDAVRGLLFASAA